MVVKMPSQEELEELVDSMPFESIVAPIGLKKYFTLRRGVVEFLLGKKPRAVKAVDGVTFFIKPGEVFGLAGESGCGKTTTGKVIIRLYDPTDGRVLFKPSKELLDKVLDMTGGSIPTYKGYVDIGSLPAKYVHPFRRELQMMFQDPYGALNPRYRIKTILEEPLIVHKIGDTPEERLELVMKALEDVKLTPPEDFMERFPHMLSGGQRQRVAMARALILGSRFMVADEPVSMIDMSMRAELLELMMEVKRKRDLTYLYITHDLATARYLCDRLAIMYLGKIVEMGDSDEVIDDPLHPYTQALIEAIPEPDPSNRPKMREVPIKGEVPSAVNVPPGCRFHPRCVVLDQHPELADKCKKEEPPLVEVKPGKYVACWLYVKQ